MKHMRKKLCILLCLLTALCLTACGGSGGSHAQSISFSDAASIEAIEKLNGQTVSIAGYMATLSPINGEYMYLMNMPYQSCPFCVPNTTQLANTLAVYAKKGKTFDYTDQAIRVTGTMQVEDYSDGFGYEYNYRLVDASYETIDLSSVSEDYALWQTIASDGIVGEVNAMFDYLYFICQWTDYTMTWTNDNGTDETVYLYPGDVENYLADSGLYGYADKAAESYFPSLIERARAISETELEDLTAIIVKAQEAEAYARSELAEGHYAYDEDSDRYVLDNGDELYARWHDAYLDFSDWLAKWQL